MIIEIENYTKNMEGNKILKNINITMESSKIYGFQGKNGSGKTMLMRAISGLIKPSYGEVRIDKEVLHKDISFPRSVGVLIENPDFIANYTAFQNLRTLADIKNIIGDDDIKDLLRALELDPDSKKKFKQFSLGMKQKLGIACALMENPDLIILDEPFNGLDEKSITVVKELILERKQKGALCILSCHDQNELELLCDKIYVIEHGQIKEG